MRVLIVSRTRMSGTNRCIGGLTEDGRSVRMMPKSGYWDTTSPFDIGTVWDIEYSEATQITPPHIEDIVVTAYKAAGTVQDVPAYISEHGKIWYGGIAKTFDGKLKFTGNGNGYISANDDLPAASTGFWKTKKDLRLRDDVKHYDYPVLFGPARGLSYVGEPDPIEVIPAGTIIRVSLARWWKPNDVDMELRCYAQLSGWY